MSADEIESLAIGAWISASAAPTAPTWRGAILWIWLTMISSRWFSSMGAPLVGQERPTDPRTIARAVTMIEEYRGRPRARQARAGSARRGTH